MSCPDVQSDVPGKCPKCQMDLTLQGGVGAGKSAPGKTAPGKTVYTCPMHPEVRSDEPGKCPKCQMDLIPEKKEEAEGTRTIYVCRTHPETVSDSAGQCWKESCNGMDLLPETILPGSKLLFICPIHLDVRSDSPGPCTKEGCDKNLGYKIVSEATQLAQAWICPVHPTIEEGGKMICPECKSEMRHLEFEKILSVPASAAIQTGAQTYVYIDKGEDTFDAIDVTLGPRARGAGGEEFYPVVKGLAAGQKVVVAGAFLVDAEARLSPAAGTYFGASGGAGGK